MGILAGMDLEVSLGFQSCGCRKGDRLEAGLEATGVVIGCSRWLQMQGFSSLAHPTPLCKCSGTTG